MSNNEKIEKLRTRKRGLINCTQAILIISQNGLLSNLYRLARGKLDYETDVNLLFRNNLTISNSISHCYSFTKNQIKAMELIK